MSEYSVPRPRIYILLTTHKFYLALQLSSSSHKSGSATLPPSSNCTALGAPRSS